MGPDQRPDPVGAQIPCGRAVSNVGKAGRKPVPGTRPTMKSVKLSEEDWAKARKIGNGNMAEGIRRALDIAASKELGQRGEQRQLSSNT